MKENFLIGLYIYAILSLCLWGFRAMSTDCAHRYMDYVFPITKLHCEVH